MGMSWNDEYTTGNVLDVLYDQNCYKLIGIDLSRQTSTSIPQQITFIGEIEDDGVATIFFIAEKLQKKIINFSLDSLIFTEKCKKGTEKNIKFIVWSK